MSMSVETPQSVCYFGLARCDVTPPVGTPLAGYGVAPRRRSSPNLTPGAPDHFFTGSTGERDPVYARALYVSDGKARSSSSSGVRRR